MLNNKTHGSTIGAESAEAKVPSCPSCSSPDIDVFHRTAPIPVNSVLNLRTRDDALRFPKGNLALGFCRGCGFIHNTVFDSQLVEYSAQCEESQGYSPTFSAFARELAESLIEEHDLRNRTILEIGCGKGEFLDLICDLGNNTGIGFDPAYVPGRIQHKAHDRLTFVREFYSDANAHVSCDMVCCRMTLEHIQETADLVGLVRRAIADRSDVIVVFQVPNVVRILENCSFEDIYYEHCSYFSPGSLARLFRSCDFDIIGLRTVYDDQYIVLEAVPVLGSQPTHGTLEDDLSLLTDLVSGFQRRYPSVIAHWENRLNRFQASGQRVAIWGSGSKGVAFLNSLRGSDSIEYAVDINPHRQGTYMAGTGQFIVAPAELQSYRPDVVIVMNPIYTAEIREELARMHQQPEILALGDQSLELPQE